MTAPPRDPAQLLPGVLAHVTGAAHRGNLPPFAGRLGLTPHDWALAARFCQQHMPSDLKNEAEQGWPPTDASPPPAPPLFAALVQHMQASRSPQADAAHTRWLAHASAAACWGRLHLWQELGLRGREEVSALLARHFAPLHGRNVQHLRWKRFLFADLGQALGQPALAAPGCQHCADHDHCYPQESRRGV